MTDPNIPSSPTGRTKPIKVFRGPGGLSVSIFENKRDRDGSTLVYYRATLQKTYKDDGFKKASSLNRDDLPVASHLLQQAWEFVLQEEAKQKEVRLRTDN